MNYFLNKKLNSDKLINYGFKQLNGKYIYSAMILNEEFRLEIEISEPANVITKLTEIDSNELYTLHLTSAQGAFVGTVRESYNKILEDIADKCFDASIFKFDYTYKIIDYINKKYNDEIEYLWQKFPDNGIARRKDNRKWYLVLLTVKKDKLGIDGEDKIEIINLRINKEELPELLKQNNIYPAYHMNKKNWISVILDGSMDLKELYEKIDKSYILALKK